MKIPARIAAGDSTTWIDAGFTGPNGVAVTAPTYTLTYSLRGAGAALDVTAAASGTGWQTSLTGTQTAALNTTPAAVTWYWSAYATNGSTRYSAGQGTLYVDPNLQALSGTYDGTTQEEKDLVAIRAEISSRISGGATIEYAIGNRSLKKEPISALLMLEARYKTIVSRQRLASAVANGLGNPAKSFVRFS
jgi:hypothetical protein